jgi:hypothetical protein
LAGDPALCARLGEAGFVEAVMRYTWPQVAQSIYRSLKVDDVIVAPGPRGDHAGRAKRRRPSARDAVAVAQTASPARTPPSTKRKANRRIAVSGPE